MRRDIKNNIEGILSGEIRFRYNNTIRNWLIKKNLLEYKCNCCGLDSWRGEEISLELDHIDGDHWNNRRNNIQFLCPNCHSLTENYKGKKKEKKEKGGTVLDKEQIIKLIREGKNIHEVLQILNIKVGGNYNIIYRLLKEEDIILPTKAEKSILRKTIDNDKIVNRINKLKSDIELIKNSDIDFNRRGWGIKVGKLIGITSSAALRFIKREMPEFAYNCYKHES